MVAVERIFVAVMFAMFHYTSHVFVVELLDSTMLKPVARQDC